MNLARYCLLVLLTLLLASPLPANNTADTPLRLLVLGDSLTSGYGLPAEDAFPERLEESLRKTGLNITVINASVSGDTSAGGLSRLDWALNDHPHLVILELGANDALRGLPAQQTYKNLDVMIGRVVGKGIKVILAGMQAPRNLGPEYVEEFDRIYPTLADKHKLTLYPFFLEGVALDPTLNQADGLHPNAAGVSIIVQKILPYVLTQIRALTEQ